VLPSIGHGVGEPTNTSWEIHGVSQGNSACFIGHNCQPHMCWRSYVHGHPNYFSRYMRDDMGWPAVHLKHPGLGNDTKEGWRRDGWWYRSGEDWEFGICPPSFKRTCPVRRDWGSISLFSQRQVSTLTTFLVKTQAGSTHKAVDLRTGSNVLPVNDTDFAFRARERADTFRVTAAGRWVETGGECIDHVMDGCFNNGTCVAPDTVRLPCHRFTKARLYPLGVTDWFVCACAGYDSV
jgi:hypothetical protein